MLGQYLGLTFRTVRSCHMGIACLATGMVVLIGVAGCSRTVVDPTPPAQHDLQSVLDVKAKCFSTDVDVPRTLMDPLVQILDEHTTRKTFNADKGTYSIDARYFLDMSDASHQPLPPWAYKPYILGESSLADHQIAETIFSIVTPTSRLWDVELHGEVLPHPFYGIGMWIVKVDAMLDPNTCDATLERFVAGPREIVLYPEEEGRKP